MISMLCQKSNEGVIKAENLDLFNYIFNGEQQINEKADDDSRLTKYNTELDSDFLKKFPTLNKDYNEEKNESSFNRITKSSLGISSWETPTNKKSSKSCKTAPNSAATRKSSQSNSISSKQEQLLAEQRQKEKHQNQNRRFRSKKLQNIQLWLEKNLNKDSTNLEIYNELNEILLKEREISEDVNKDLYDFAVKEYRKRELLYKNWYLNVYEPVKTQVTKNITENGKYARNVRNEKYLEYLNQVNRRGCSFQDDFEPEDYNPIDIVQIDANLGKRLKDPTNLPLRKTHLEDHTIIRCISGRNLNQKETQQTRLPVIINDSETRGDLDWNYWTLKHHDQIESTARVKSGLRCKPIRHTATFNNDWNRDKNLNEFISSNSVYVDHTKKLSPKENTQ